MNTFDQILVEIKGDSIEASLLGAFNPKTSEFVLNKPFHLQYLLDNPLFQAAFPSGPILAKPTSIHLSIATLTLPPLQ